MQILTSVTFNVNFNLVSLRNLQLGLARGLELSSKNVISDYQDHPYNLPLCLRI